MGTSACLTACPLIPLLSSNLEQNV
uniref:Uncharacterized protein n=1 Tax=Arundo donax TaxID=35708 RepID=A0A0A9ARB0_ARUDO